MNGCNKGNNIMCLIEDIDHLSDYENYSWESVELENNNDDNNNKNNLITYKICALELNYKLNYSFKYLGYIFDYYGISKSKLKKESMIEKLLEFEINPLNNELVERRKLLFDNMGELKNDEYFKKYIMWNI